MSFSQFFGFDIAYMITVWNHGKNVFTLYCRCFIIQDLGPLTKTGFVRKDQPLPPYIIAAFCISVDYNVDLIWFKPAVVVVVILKAKICRFIEKWENLFVIF